MDEYDWQLVSMEVTKDVTTKIYEDEKTRHTKTVWEYWKFNQYHAYIDNVISVITDADGVLIS